MVKLLAKLLDSRVVLGLVLTVLGASAAQAAEVKAVRLGVHDDHTRLVLDLSAAIKFTVSEQSDGLVVIKLDGATPAPTLQPALAGQGLIRTINLEPHGKTLEIKIALVPGTRLQRYDALEATGPVPARVFLDVVQQTAATSPAPAAASQPAPAVAPSQSTATAAN